MSVICVIFPLTICGERRSLSSMKAWQTAVLVLLIGVGVALILKLQSPIKVAPPSSGAQTAASATEQRPAPLDLTSFYDNDTSFDAPGSWQAVPRGVQKLGNIPFNIGGLIQLWGEGPAGMGRNYRERVEGIPATGRFHTLYLLHGTSFTAAEGTPIAEVVFRYTDGSSATNSIRYGTDSRDWWQPLAEHTPLPTNSLSQVVWRGDHTDLPDWVRSLRLFGAGIANPKPGIAVNGVDLLSTKSRVTWLVLAMTTGPGGLMKVNPALESGVDVPAEETAMVLTAVDKDTGQPIPGTKFQITLLSGRRPKPYGAFTADKHGQAIVDLPPEPIKLLSIATDSSDYPPSTLSWNVEKGEKIPTNCVFKLSKKTQEHTPTATAKPEIVVPMPNGTNRVTAAAVFEPATAAPGDTVTLLVRVRTAPGHWIYALDDSGSRNVATTLTTAAPRPPFGLTGSWRGPQPKVKDDGSRVYAGDVVFQGRFTIERPAPNAIQKLPVTLKYQVCNEALCWPPATISLEPVLKVVR